MQQPTPPFPPEKKKEEDKKRNQTSFVFFWRQRYRRRNATFIDEILKEPTLLYILVVETVTKSNVINATALPP